MQSYPLRCVQVFCLEEQPKVQSVKVCMEVLWLKGYNSHKRNKWTRKASNPNPNPKLMLESLIAIFILSTHQMLKLMQRAVLLRGSSVEDDVHRNPSGCSVLEVTNHRFVRQFICYHGDQLPNTNAGSCLVYFFCIQPIKGLF